MIRPSTNSRNGFADDPSRERPVDSGWGQREEHVAFDIKYRSRTAGREVCLQRVVVRIHLRLGNPPGPDETIGRVALRRFNLGFCFGLDFGFIYRLGFRLSNLFWCCFGFGLGRFLNGRR
jgi:hypothetical protein